MYRVLVVDDEMPALRFVTSIVEQFAKQFQIAGTATGAEQALKFLQQHAVDLLITDISMHGMNGIELAQTARKMHPGIHIVIISGFGEFEYAQAMDEVRRSEQKATRSKALNTSKRLLMIPERKHSAEQAQKVSALCKEYPKTGRAFRMVQALDVVYASNNYDEAKARYQELYRWLRKSRLEPMKKVTLTLRKYADEILNIFQTRMTNAICEGINSMIQAAKRKARGFHTFEGFSSMIYLIAAKLSLACPNPLR